MFVSRVSMLSFSARSRFISCMCAPAPAPSKAEHHRSGGENRRYKMQTLHKTYFLRSISVGALLVSNPLQLHLRFIHSFHWNWSLRIVLFEFPHTASVSSLFSKYERRIDGKISQENTISNRLNYTFAFVKSLAGAERGGSAGRRKEIHRPSCVYWKITISDRLLKVFCIFPFSWILLSSLLCPLALRGFGLISLFHISNHKISVKILIQISLEPNRSWNIHGQNGKERWKLCIMVIFQSKAKLLILFF